MKKISPVLRKKGKSFQSRCKECTRLASKIHYENNKKYYKSKSKTRNKYQYNLLRDYYWNYLCSSSCMDCGNADPLVLEFDHVRGTKYKEVSKMISGYYSIERLIEEISKCEIRCANCHKKKTALQFKFWKDKV